MGLERLTPLYCARLFEPLHAELVALLRGLEGADWERPTLAGSWRVRDVAGHLLDDDLRKLAVYRDGHPLPAPPGVTAEADLSRFINGLNAQGVAYAARLSPRLLLDLLVITGRWVSLVVSALPPHARSIFAVSWAGESASENWMDTGREYTERWHHQMQIREAVGVSRLLQPRWMEPLLDVSVRALPHAYAQQEAPLATVVTLEVHGETSGAWSVVREEAGWAIWRGRPDACHALVRVAADDAWRLFYNALPAGQAASRVEVIGEAALTLPLLRARSVVL